MGSTWNVAYRDKETGDLEVTPTEGFVDSMQTEEKLQKDGHEVFGHHKRL